MSTIFISHSSQDNEIAKELERRLAEKHHHSVFLDLDPEKGIVAGQSWERTLYRKLRACRAVIALCTDHYLRSHWCFAEIALARMEGKHIVALQVDSLSAQAKMPAILSERQFIDLRQKEDEGYRRLWKGLKEMSLLGLPGEWDPKKPPYLGLNAYQEEHASVFFGREEEAQAGLELLGRGAPGLIMVLGASGSGKSSLVQAGMIPRLRREEGQWLVVDPFRPGQEPFVELARSLAQTYRRYAPEHASRAGSWEQIRDRLEAWSEKPSISEAKAGTELEVGEHEPRPTDDERLERLLIQLEDLRQRPPERAEGSLFDFLDWSLDDLRRICGQGSPSASTQKAAVPGKSPLVDLAERLRRDSEQRDARVLLVIDQFEEMLSHNGINDKADRFLSLLRTSLEAENSPLMAIGTMRSDFLGAFQRNTSLRGIDFESLSLGPMKIDGMRRVIEEPAKLGAIELEKGLADQLLEDTETPDALPLLSFTLWVMWRDYRRDGKLEIREYEQLGGLHGAVAREADALLASAKREGKEEALRQAFVRMVRLTEEGRYAREPMSWDTEELRAVHAILERFVERRLLVSRGEEGGARTVEVAHEALFRSWKPLKTWLENHRAELLLKQQLRRDAEAWEESHRAADTLWRGGRLQQAQELMRKGELRGADAHRSLEAAFVRVGVRRRRFRLLTLCGVTLCVFAVLTYLLWIAKKEAKNAQEMLARNYWLNAVQANERGNWLEAVHFFARSAEKTFDPRQMRNSAFNIMQRGTKNLFLGAQIEHASSIRGLVLSKDQSLVLTWSEDGTARLWHSADGSAATNQPLKHDGEVWGAIFNHDGSLVLTWSEDGTARLWHSADGSAATNQPLQHNGEVWGATFNHDGSLVLTWSEDGTARLWHSADGSAATNQPLQHKGEVWGATFNHDGSRVLTWSEDGTARLWHSADGSAATNQPLQHDKAVNGATFNHDGSRVLTCSADGTARLWHSADGSAATNQPLKHDRAVKGAIFNRDGSRVLTWSEDGTARLWHSADGSAATNQPLKHDSPVWGATFNHDGSRVLTRSEDGTARLWHSADGSAATNQPLKHGNRPVQGATFNHDGSRVLTWSEDGTARLWHSADGSAATNQPLKHGKAVRVATFNHDGSRVLTWSEDGTARLWHIADGSAATIQPLKHGKAVRVATFNHDGSRVLTWSEDGTARLWHIADGSAATNQPLKHGNRPVQGAIFNHDGSRVLTWSEGDGTARLWHSADGSAATNQPLKHDNRPVQGATFNHDGSQVLTWSGGDGTARLWHSADGYAATNQPLKHGMGFKGATFNHDGSRVLTWSWDGMARLWHIADGSAATNQPLKHGNRPVQGAIFNHDGSRVLTWSADGTARLWHSADGSAATNQPLKHGNRPVQGAIFNHDGSRVLTWSADGTARLWHSADGSAATNQPLKHGNRPVWGATFNHDGSRVLTWSADGTARLWHSADGSAATNQPLKHGMEVKGATFNHDGSRVLTWSRDGLARLWHSADGSAATNQPLKHDGAVNGATFNHDGSRVLTWSDDGTARLWDIGVDYDFPRAYLSLWIEVVTGAAMDDSDMVAVLNTEEWTERKEKYIAIAEKHLATCRYKDANIYLSQKLFWEKGSKVR